MLRKLLKYTFIFFAVLYVAADLCIYFWYKDKGTEERIEWITRKCSSVPEDSIPDNIIQAYGRVFPNSLTSHIYPDVIWSLFIEEKHTRIQVQLASFIQPGGRIQITSMANQLDNKLTCKECLYVYLLRFDFLNNVRGIRKAAQFYYHKNLEELTERECLELVIMTKNAARYNKLMHQDLLDEEVNKISGL